MELMPHVKQGIFMDMRRCLSQISDGRKDDVFFVRKAFDKATINNITKVFITDVILLDFPFKCYYGHFASFTQSAN